LKSRDTNQAQPHHSENSHPKRHRTKRAKHKLVATESTDQEIELENQKIETATKIRPVYQQLELKTPKAAAGNW
jgi:hypothetical protein